MSYIVVYDDGMGFCNPYSFDENCKGALRCFDGSVAVFGSRKEARQSIRISTAFARLNKAQGLPVNFDFINELTYVKIVELVSKESKQSN